MEASTVTILKKASAPWNWKLRGLQKLRVGILMCTCFLLPNPAVNLNICHCDVNRTENYRYQICSYSHSGYSRYMLAYSAVKIEKLMSLKVYMLLRSKTSWHWYINRTILWTLFIIVIFETGLCFWNLVSNKNYDDIMSKNNYQSYTCYFYCL
jgi:hypothetical protein